MSIKQTSQVIIKAAHCFIHLYLSLLVFPSSVFFHVCVDKFTEGASNNEPTFS